MQRYLASVFDRLSNRLPDPSGIAAIEVVAGSVQQRATAYSIAVLDRGRIDEGELHVEATIVSTS